MRELVVGMITINKSSRVKDVVFGVGMGDAPGGITNEMLLVADGNL